MKEIRKEDTVKKNSAQQKVATADLKKAIVAVESERLKHPAKFRADRAQRAVLQKSRRESEKAQSAFLKKAGLELKEFQTLQEQRSAERERMVAQHKADALKLASQQKDTFYSSSRGQSKALGELAAKTGFFPNPTFTLDTPFLIWSIPLTDISDSAAVPFGSWAKFKFATSQSGIQKVGFYFYWPNPYQDYAVINAITFMSAIGYLRSHAPWGIETNGSAVYAWALLNLWFGWPTSVTSSASANQFLGSAGAYGSFITGGDTRGISISSGANLSTTMFAVPPKTVVVFEVALLLEYDNDSGDIEADFETGEFKIECPVVVFSLLNKPTHVMG